jgi:hypothetical protein
VKFFGKNILFLLRRIYSHAMVHARWPTGIGGKAANQREEIVISSRTGRLCAEWLNPAKPGLMEETTYEAHAYRFGRCDHFVERGPR